MARSWGYNHDYFPPPSRPLAAKGGIKAQSKRGAFGDTWWAKRWIAVLESFQIGARLDRGRSYARRGQVLAVTIDKGVVTAKVQGSRPTPYKVTIKLNVLTAADWRNLAAVLSQQVLYSAKLLAGEMPQDVEDAFRDAGLSLFPAKLADLKTECSCPDWSNPCKHIAAVYYLLGEEFDRNPFLIFTLRGMTREELVALLDPGTQKTGAQKPKRGDKGKRAADSDATADAPAASEPLAVDAAVFWNGDNLADDLIGEVQIPATPAAIVRRLGNFPFWRGEEQFYNAIEPIYKNASPRGLDIFLGAMEEK